MSGRNIVECGDEYGSQTNNRGLHIFWKLEWEELIDWINDLDKYFEYEGVVEERKVCLYKA